MSKLVVFGSGKIADQAYFYFTNDSPYEIEAFTVDSAFLTKEEMFGRPVVPFEDVQNRYPPSDTESQNIGEFSVGYNNTFSTLAGCPMSTNMNNPHITTDDIARNSPSIVTFPNAL